MRARFVFAVVIIATILSGLAIDPATAHHVMGSKLPATFVQGALSGLGHPIIGLDHFAAVVAVGCLAAMHRSGAVLALGYVLPMVAGAALHVREASVPGAELLVAFSVIALGLLMVRGRGLPMAATLGLFALTGLLHGYALGESIVGAESAPLYAYFAGLTLIQLLIALGAMLAARMAAAVGSPELTTLRLIGAGITGIGLA